MPNIEEHLRKAMQEGKFNDLPGKGQPLHMEEVNPHADPEWELAYRMLKEAGYSLPWIESLREIEVSLESARADLRLAWECFQLEQSQSQLTTSASINWERSQSAFREQIIELNKRIREVNLQVPLSRFQRLVLNADQELLTITSNKTNL